VIFAPLIQATSNLPTDSSALVSSISALERDASALESAIRALEISSARWEPWVWVFSALVVIGVVMELWVIRHDWRDEWEIFAIWHFVGVTRSPSRPSRLKLWIEFISVVLISVGVSGELGIGIKIASINNDLRGKSAVLRSKNSELRTASDELVTLVNLEAEQAKERTAKLQAAMMLRHLSKEQGDALCSAIPQSHANEVSVTSSSQDWESFRYAQDFSEALTKCIYAAGFGSRGFSGQLGVGNSFWSQNVLFGVWVRFQKHLTLDDSRSPDLTINPLKRRALAEAVRNALLSRGVKVEGVSDEGRSTLDIYVGPRFPPKDEPETSASQTSNH